MSDQATATSPLEAATAELAERESALAEIVAGVKAMKKDPEANATVALFRKMVDDSKAHVEKIATQIKNAERADRTKTIVDPLIAKFGTVVVTEANEFRVEFVDISSTRAKLLASANAITSKIAALDALSAAIAALEISEETAADLKAVRFAVASPSSYKLEMARTGTRASGGTRVSSSGQIFTITHASEDHANLVGTLIGKGKDFETWRALIQKTDPAMFKALEDKRTDANKTGKKSNYSAAVVAERKFGIKYTSTSAT